MQSFTGTPDALSLLQQSLFFEDEVSSAATRPQLTRRGGVCAVCAEGHVLFRTSANAAVDTKIVDAVGPVVDAPPTLRHFTVCLESAEERAREAAVRPHCLSPLCDARDCVAQLYNLGLLRPPRAIETSVHNASCVQLSVALHVLDDAVTASTHCSAVVAQLRPSRNASTPQPVEVVMPRLTAWPMKRTTRRDDGDDSRSGSKPLYFGVAAVKDTDVDGDLPPPSAITVQENGRVITIKFNSGSTASGDQTAASPDLHCPLHFVTVRLGRYGRHHNQLQEILNTVALAARLNRTFIIPPFVPASYAEFVKLDTRIFYGWHTLREMGHYCLVTYAEVRPVLLQVYARTGKPAMMTMQRVHIAIHATAQQRLAQMSKEEGERRTWGHLLRVPATPTAVTGAASDSAPLYDADEWFACGVRDALNEQAFLRRRGEKEAKLILRETHPPLTPASLNMQREANSTCWESYLTGVRAVVERYGGRRRQREGGDLQAYHEPDVVVLSSYTAFHVRPRLVEMARLLGLLRPSPYITSEVGRFYRLWAPQYKWPAYANPQRTFDDCLQPYRFKNVVGLHVRRRELTCQREVAQMSQTILSLSEGLYVLDGTGQLDLAAGSAPFTTTVARLTNDCVWDVRSVVHLFYQYSQWLSGQESEPGHRTLAASGAGELRNDVAPQHYTSYVAHDGQAGPIGQEMEVALQHRYSPAPDELLADGTRPSFTAFYDRRSSVDFSLAYQRARERLTTPTADPTNATAVEAAAAWETARLIELLYPVAELELMGMAFDFFMLSNTEVFRGNVISSVSINVCVRRWGRGLPCHGVMVGYYEALYKGFL
ncbi:phosphoglycan beta 12 arabinosyltransferase (SCA like) [Leptomonas pyrrhocoris]|uniref:Phosphoglycan beta 12 arabinosyltransferase (SCA like) n=1 Tax=Leptomonas pyrrhocoris TaxID=157538 RepID=A0A0N0DWQ4_LEPPY|nr:phosphoglycan beta 12 arabinosyltransferase (SCA like) [Leptomonas pyrrhocoris]KPA82052.1 phosphoglycan beta 12 arabinosyltransferase (SCA like) [Leptomonas pyrrhocoris]|eukprot:XP_015660491.1 phosphoglycan beta 12 arabinosyltransferase (SCA like) [Leptomonas pyrrhocoris]